MEVLSFENLHSVEATASLVKTKKSCFLIHETLGQLLTVACKGHIACICFGSLKINPQTKK